MKASSLVSFFICSLLVGSFASSIRYKILPSTSPACTAISTVTPSASVSTSVSTSVTPSTAVVGLVTPSVSPSVTPSSAVFGIVTPSVSPSVTSSSAAALVTPSVSPSVTPSATASASASVSGMPIDIDQPFEELGCTGPPRIRKEFRNLNRDEYNSLVRAILAAQQPGPNGEQSEWEQMVAMHFDGRAQAHNGCFFLPWHRLFLLRMENILRKYEPEVTIPFWEWTADSSNPALSPLWGADFFGGANSGATIPDGPFAGTAIRGFNSVDRGLRDFWNKGDLERGITTLQNWYLFSAHIEVRHIRPHAAIGGDMVSTASAPRDIVFYLHHAYIDSFMDKRHAHTGDPSEFSGNPQCDPDQILEHFGVPASNGLKIDCVTYSTEAVNGVNPPLAAAAAPPGAASGAPPQASQEPEDVSDIMCEDPEFLERSGMSFDFCALARSL